MARIIPLDQKGLEAPPGRPEPPLDRYDRYLIPDPLTGEKRSWTRATTWAKTISSAYDLMWWQLEATALGLARRQDLAVSVAAIHDPYSKEGKRQLDRLINRAQEETKADERRNLGSALHSFAEAHDSGRELAVPPPFDRDLEAYKYAMRAVDVSRNYIEQICVVPELGVAGTMDRVVRFKHGLRGDPIPMIGDLKTGREPKFLEIAIQLALYAHAHTTYDMETDRHRPMLKVDQERALVIHLPAGEGRCQLYLVDIKAGWEMALLCGKIREHRARRDLCELVVDWSVKPEELK